MTRILVPFRSLAAVLLLGVAGAVLLPWQASLHKEEIDAHFGGIPMNLSLREQVGQSGFLAALSGFRSPLAACLWIEAHTAWENTEWGRMQSLFHTVTTLQPHTLLYWDIAAWHMAWNASTAALQDTRQQSELLRERARMQYIALGRDFLERGIRNNPDKSLLYERLGAADAFAKAASFPDAPAYIRRFAAYESALAPGREREAYDRLHALYDEGQKTWSPSMISRIRALEEKLGISQEQRMIISAPVR